MIRTAYGQTKKTNAKYAAYHHHVVLNKNRSPSLKLLSAAEEDDKMGRNNRISS